MSIALAIVYTCLVYLFAKHARKLDAESSLLVLYRETPFTPSSRPLVRQGRSYLRETNYL